MKFLEAVSSVLRQYVGFRGRARRSEYWWFALFAVLVGIVASGLDALLGLTDATTGQGPIGLLVGLALLLPQLAVGVRRLHDTGRSGWWILLGLILIVGAIILIVWFCKDSAPGTNQHGPNPKGVDPALGYGDPQGYGQVAGYGQAPGYDQTGGYRQAGQPGQDGAPDPRFGTPPQP